MFIILQSKIVIRFYTEGYKGIQKSESKNTRTVYVTLFDRKKSNNIIILCLIFM